MRTFTETVVWLVFFAAVFFAWYFYLKARNKERMALIERDKDVSEIYSKQEIRIRVPWLRIGLLVTGVGLGYIVAIVISMVPFMNTFMREAGEVIPISAMIFFGGIGIILGHYLDKTKK